MEKIGLRVISILLIVLLTELLLLICSAPVWADVYLITPQDIRTEWEYPAGTVDMEGGRVRPVFVRKNINVCRDAARFGGGIKAVGSNAGEAAHIIDGDLTTWWGPSEGDDLKDWWIEVDLGRLVTVTKLRLLFSEGGKPFEFFTIYGSSGYPLIGSFGSPLPNTREYHLIGKVTSQNTNYVLEFDAPPDNPRIVRDGPYYRYIRLVVTEKKSESPRLAELEVYSVGDNVTLGSLERGGKATASFNEEKAAHVFDGAVVTGWCLTAAGTHRLDMGVLEVDLGALFWVDTIRLVGIVDAWVIDSVVKPWRWYTLYASDGSRAPDGSIRYEEIARLPSNPERLLNTAHQFSARPIRYVRFAAPSSYDPAKPDVMWGTLDSGSLDELQLYGEGYLPRVTLRSDLIDLGRSKNLFSVGWDADTPPGTNVRIRTRTGDTVEETKHYYNQSGKETTEAEWKKTPSFYRGPVKTEIIPGSDWSAWSRVYHRAGEGFLSPSPRRYVQLEVHLISEDPFSAAFLGSLRLSYSSPLATELVGEISPFVVQPAVPDTFCYFILPSYGPGCLGFNTVGIKIPPEIEVREVAFIQAKVGGLPIEAAGEVVSGELRVVLPKVVRRDLVEIQFRCTLFRRGLLFNAYVANTAFPAVRQRVDPGDATDLVHSQTLIVSLPEDERVLAHVSITPRTITPNGDGISDEMLFDFTVLKVSRPRRIRVRIYDLRGDAVKELMNDLGMYGRYCLSWDGRDTSGRRVPSGVYICRIGVEADLKETTRLSTVSVVY